MSAKGVTALALIDGEHYPDVVRDALAELPYTVARRGAPGRHGEDPRRRGIRGGPSLATSRTGSSGQAPRSWSTSRTSRSSMLAGRLRLASRALAAGRPYVGADFRFEPMAFAPFGLPSLAVVGSGKRVGKTAVAGHLARLLSEDREVVVVAMGRGGPSGSGRHRHAAEPRRPAGALAWRFPRGLGLPGGRSAREGRHDRLPALRRRARRAAIHLERRGGGPGGGRAPARPGRLRRQWDVGTARGGGCPRPRCRGRTGPGARRGVSRRLSHPDLRPRPRDGLRGATRRAGTRRSASERDRGSRSRARGRRDRASPAPGRAGRRQARRLLLDSAGWDPRPASLPSRRGGERRRRAGVRKPEPPGRAPRRSRLGRRA